MSRRLVLILSVAWLGTLAGPGCPAVLAATVLRAGTARVDVTPKEPIRLTGYAVRRTNSVGVEQKLWAKALALSSGNEPALVLVTLDHCGITEQTYRELTRRLLQKTGLSPDRIAIAISHTHEGPATENWAPNIFIEDLPEAQNEVIARHTRDLVDKMEWVVARALEAREPATVGFGRGKVEFARNRRGVKPNPALGTNATEAVDHDLPVLKVCDEAGAVRALVATYACHCTTIGGEFNRVCGDWAGFAQEAIEREHPGALGLITIGCGADSNPFPRGGADGGLALARSHGEEVAAEVKRVIRGDMGLISGPLASRLSEFELPQDPPFTREQWTTRAKAQRIVGYHARKNLARLDRGESIPTTLPYLTQSWDLGGKLAWVFLPGEVVVDYALRLKKEFKASPLWVTGYANFVPCYIPSRRILAEGGYEAEESLWYYDRPARIAPEAEDLIVGQVHKLLAR